MSQGGKKHMGPGSHGKHDGSGGMSGMPDIPENKVLSNRDKAHNNGDRGQDSKWNQAEQFHDTEASHLKDDE